MNGVCWCEETRDIAIPLRHMTEGDWLLVADSDTPDFVVDHHLSLAMKPGNS